MPFAFSIRTEYEGMHFCFALMQKIYVSRIFSITDVLFHVGPRKQLNSCVVSQNFKMSLKLDATFTLHETNLFKFSQEKRETDDLKEISRRVA